MERKEGNVFGLHFGANGDGTVKEMPRYLSIFLFFCFLFLFLFSFFKNDYLIIIIKILDDNYQFLEFMQINK